MLNPVAVPNDVSASPTVQPRVLSRSQSMTSSKFPPDKIMMGDDDDDSAITMAGVVMIVLWIV